MSCRSLWIRLLSSTKPVTALAALDMVTRLVQIEALNEAKQVITTIYNALMLRRDAAQMDEDIVCLCQYEWRDSVQMLSFSECEALVEHVEKMADAFSWQFNESINIEGHMRCAMHRHIHYGKLHLNAETTADRNEVVSDTSDVIISDDIDVSPSSDHHHEITHTIEGDNKQRKRKRGRPTSSKPDVHSAIQGSQSSSSEVPSRQIQHIQAANQFADQSDTSSTNQSINQSTSVSAEEAAVIDRWKRPNKRLVRFQLVASLPEDEQLKEQLRLFNEAQKSLETFRNGRSSPRSATRTSSPIDLTESPENDMEQ